MAAPTAKRSCALAGRSASALSSAAACGPGIWSIQGERRPQQLEQAGEGDVSLRLHPPRPQHIHAGRLLLRVGEQRGLADPGLPDDGQYATVAGPSVLEQPDERQLLLIAAEQHVSECTEAPGTKPRRRGSD